MKQKHAFKSLIGTATIFVLCVSMMFAMVGCGSSDSSAGSNSDSTAAGDSTAKDSKKAAGKEVKLAEFSVKSKDGKEVSLGMKKEDVVKLLGEGKEGSFQDMYEYGQLSVSYKDNVANNIIFQRMSSDEQSEYTFKGIKLGDKKADIIKALGEPSKPFSDVTADKKVAEYYYKVNGENGTFVSSTRDMIEDTSSSMYISYSFKFGDNDELESVTALYVDMK
jgi:hypothetical protein